VGVPVQLAICARVLEVNVMMVVRGKLLRSALAMRVIVSVRSECIDVHFVGGTR
jgi:hypothetical protein